MKTLLHLLRCRLSLLFILILVASCKKDMDSANELSKKYYTVQFHVKNFDSSFSPLGLRSSNKRNELVLKSKSSSQHLQEGYLYYWSFNEENLNPDIALHAGTSIHYNGGNASSGYAAGWAYDSYSAGRAISVTGLRELVVRMSMRDVLQLTSLGFDISSSGTGPKSFELFYSLDNKTWMSVIQDNQFMNTNTSQARNTFTYDMSALSVENMDELHIKIVPKAGNRGTANAYNENSGLTRLDNFHLKGIANVTHSASLDKLHYYIFDAKTDQLVASDYLDYDQASKITLSLSGGNYYASFIRNMSSVDLIFPNNVVNKRDYYFSNLFSNHLASVFAREKNFEIRENHESTIELQRYYSQIKFEFTDSRDLSLVKRIVISPLHDPFFHAPFDSGMVNPLIDQDGIDIEPDFSSSKTVVFNQFMGSLATAKMVRYQMDVYGEKDMLIRTFTVAGDIRNNVQLVFRGELLSGVAHQAMFHVSINEDWGEEKVIGF